MDNFLYIAMTGAKENMNALAIRGNNLANTGTTGFKADLEQARSMQAFGEGMPTRVFSITESPSQNFEFGGLQTTGRNLDVAVEGDGWIAVETPGGEEVYTRAGNLNIDTTGVLKDGHGNTVLSITGAPIVFPLPIEGVEINRDGMIEIRPEGAPANATEELGRIKTVKPRIEDLTKGSDGLFRQTNGEPADVSAEVSLISGALEASNVNAVEEMTHMIALQRQFEMQIKMMKTAEEIDQASDSLLRIV